MMKIEKFRWVTGVIAAHPNCKLFGRTRLQKEIKLLQRLGMPSGYVYRMHFYGPYSDDLQSDIQLLTAFEFVNETSVQNREDRRPYSVFESHDQFKLEELNNYQQAIDLLAETDSTVLELAATYDAFLHDFGMDKDKALNSLRAKKAGKCTKENEEKAFVLLESLGIS